MSDLLLEIFSEEIPARMQVQAAKDLERLVVGALSDRGLLFEGVKAFSGPRRLTFAITGLPAKQPDVSEEKKGPRINAPAKAIEGFLRSAGVTLEECEKRDDGKGEFYVAVINRQGRPTIEVLAELLPEAMAKLPWPKSMRWGTAGATRWVRPLHSIVATLEGEVIPFTFANVASGNKTLGHRFLSSGEITVKRFEDYEAALKKAHVILDAEERKARIYDELKQAAFVHGLELIEDEGLLNEVSGLAEWPVVLIGKIQDEFMDVPAEILQTSMRTHQKYFSLRDPKTQRMANRFAVVSNMVASDGGKEIIAGNERVLRARLSDAKFFWDQDRKTKLEARVDALKDIVFHAKLGTQYERVERIEALAAQVGKSIGLGVEGLQRARRASLLSKADLTTGVVGEFPELQGVMGRYYALHDHEDEAVCDAIRDHYKPLGPNDSVPQAPVSAVVALADKFDSLVAFFTADERPTGSSDPFALRRAALGIIRLLLSNGLHVRVKELSEVALIRVLKRVDTKKLTELSTALEGGLHVDNILDFISDVEEFFSKTVWLPIFNQRVQPHKFREAVKSKRIVLNYGDHNVGEFLEGVRRIISFVDTISFDFDEDSEEQEREIAEALETFGHVPDAVLGFLADRLKVALKERGVRHDLIDAVFSLGTEDDVVLLVERVDALQLFLKSDDGANLLSGYRRAANILKAEEKKDAKLFSGDVKLSVFSEAAERELASSLSTVRDVVALALARQDFEAAMRAMAALRAPVDAFFDKVKVNADDKALRENRLQLLASLRATLHTIADFSRIEG